MIKFMWNGPKVNGVLYPSYYSWGALIGKDEKCISVYSRRKRYPAELKALFEIKNDTDMMTDYFEDDRFKVYREHHLFNDVAQGVIKMLEKRLDRQSAFAGMTGARLANALDDYEGTKRNIEELMEAISCKK